jgi:hypothetical protein
MEQKNRVWIVIAITVLITAAMFASFGRNLITLKAPSVVLPTAGADSSGQSGGSDRPASTLYRPIAITVDTVQDVVATLTRPNSYYRELTVENFWGDGGSNTLTVQFWYDGGWSHSRQVLPSGAIRHDLVGDGTWYYWYDGSQQYETVPADERSADLSQGIPTYETVLTLDKAEIITAAYEQQGGQSCILVEAQRTAPDRLERYWVSVTDGLLVCAELERDGSVVYRMTAYNAITTPCPAAGSFALPNGTVLHSIS